MKLVLIEWIDSSGCTSDWNDFASDKKLRPVAITSVGWLIEQNDEYAILVPHIARTVHVPPEGSGTMIIVNCAIKKIHDLVDPTARDPGNTHGPLTPDSHLSKDFPAITPRA